MILVRAPFDFLEPLAGLLQFLSQIIDLAHQGHDGVAHPRGEFALGNAQDAGGGADRRRRLDSLGRPGLTGISGSAGGANS